MSSRPPQDDDKIAWYENTDGAGSFGSQQVISTAADGAASVFAADVDGDGDLDVLSASAVDDKIAWYENTDGAGSFGSQQVISTAADGARSVFAADVDGDGDLDVLSASAARRQDRLVREHGRGGELRRPAGDLHGGGRGPLGLRGGRGRGRGSGCPLGLRSTTTRSPGTRTRTGRGASAAQQVISTAADGARSVFAADVDGDGDLDVLSASDVRRQDRLVREHGRGGELRDPAGDLHGGGRGLLGLRGGRGRGRGSGCPLRLRMTTTRSPGTRTRTGRGASGAQQVISTAADGARSVFAADVDGDGDLDVLSASHGDDKIAWYENQTIHRSAAFPAQTTISTAADYARSVFAADVDGDGDLDVLSASYEDDKIAWYENTDGAGSFGTQQVISTAADGAWSVFAADVDGDGDLDVLSASAVRRQDRLVREHGRGGELRHPAGDLHGGGRGPFGLRGGRGRGRGSGCPLGLRVRRQDRLVREHGRGGELRQPSR